MLIDELLLFFKRKNQASKKKDNKKKAAEQVTLLFLSSKRQYCFILKYLKIQIFSSTDYYSEPGKGNKEQFFMLLVLLDLNVKMIYYMSQLACHHVLKGKCDHSNFNQYCCEVESLLSCFYFVTILSEDMWAEMQFVWHNNAQSFLRFLSHNSFLIIIILLTCVAGGKRGRGGGDNLSPTFLFVSLCFEFS